MSTLSPRSELPLGAAPRLRADAALLRDASLVLAGGLFLLVALAVALRSAGGFDARFIPAALAVYGVIGAFAIAGLRYHPFPRFGAPNVVTTLRAVATALFAGLVLDAGQIDGSPREPWAWLFAGIAILALALDGLDGFLARRLRLASRYGARFDMEVDALLILLLSLLAFGLGKAGPFVLAIGLMRYVFVAAQFILPWLGGDLPPSMRRKAVCVLQAAVLGALVTPLVEPPVSNVLAAATALALLWSFAVDVAFLARERKPAR